MNKRKRPDWALITFICIGVIYFGIVLINQQSLLNYQNLEMEQIDNKIQDEKELNARLLRQREEVLSDEYIEKIARQKLDMVREGERIFVDVNR
ncbi:UNVERIFIED_CONTAM: cell division protein FtsL [Acetivibrio alkalicellulosi]